MAINKDYVDSSESSTEFVNEDPNMGKKTSSKDTKREEKSAIKSKDKSISQEPVVSNKDKSISQEPVVSNKRRTDKLPSVSTSPSRPQEVFPKDDNHTNIQMKADSDALVTKSVAEAVEKTVGEVVENVTDLSESKSTNNHEVYTHNPFLSAVNFWQTSVMSYLDIYKELSINTIRLTQNWFSCFFPNLYPWSRLNQ